MLKIQMKDLLLCFLGFIFGVVATITCLLLLTEPRKCERKWYILEGTEWFEYDHSNEVDKYYSDYLRTRQSTFQQKDVSYYFNSSRHSWKLWVLKSSVWHKLMFQKCD